MTFLSTLTNLLPQKSKVPTYVFVEKKADEDIIQMATKITSGKYQGTVFSTGLVTLTEKNDSLSLNFKYIIECMDESLQDGEELSQIIGDIIWEEIQKEAVADKETPTPD